MSMITSFRGKYMFLSNFYDEGNGITNEHRFMSQKTMNIEERRKILAAPTPAIAKHMGKKVALRPDWERVKIEVMRQTLMIKFKYGGELAQQLCDTGDTMLIEGNTWGDKVWGAVWDGETWGGRNLLGRLLMERRAMLQGNDVEVVING